MSPETPAASVSLEQLVRVPTIEELISVLRSTEIDLTYNHFLAVQVPWGFVNVLTQPRKTFKDIENLGENIGALGQINPITLVLFDEKHCQAYLDNVNDTWRTNYQSSDLTPISTHGTQYFCFLIAGERRFRALERLMKSGCEECRQKFGPGPCYERHFPPLLFPNRGIEGRLRPQTSPEEATDLQFSENIHMSVPPHEEARAYYNWFHHKRRGDPKYPLARFARRVGRGTDVIRKALRYCELPTDIQNCVSRGELKYGIACEIARLQEKIGISDEEARIRANDALVRNYHVEDYRKKIDKLIFDFFSGQKDMFTIFAAEATAMAERLRYRQPLAKEMINANWQFIGYFQRVFRAFQEGLLKKRDSPLSPRSPVRTFRALVAWQRETLLPHLVNLKPEEDLVRKFMTIVGGTLKVPEEDSLSGLNDPPFSEANLVRTSQKLIGIQEKLLPFFQTEGLLKPGEAEEIQKLYQELHALFTSLEQRMALEVAREQVPATIYQNLS